MQEAAEDGLELRLDPTLEASGVARGALRSVFAKRLPPKVLADLAVVVTELVTNAIVHGPGRPVTVAVRLDRDADLVRGEVVDEGEPSISIPQIRKATQGQGGYGLRLVDLMTSEWWVVEGSTSVRFEMPAALSE